MQLETAARLLFACALLLAAGTASAQSGPALAGRSAAAQNASTVNFNPAGILRLPELEVSLDGALAVSGNHFDVDGNLSSEGGGNPSNGTDVVGIPSFGVSAPAGDYLAIGVGFSVPTGFGSDYGSNWAGRYYSQEFSLVFMSLQPVVAVRATDWLYLSAGAALMYTSSETKVAINQQPFTSDDAALRLDLDGFDAGPVVGVLVEVSPELRFGASWRGEIEPELDGDPSFRNLDPSIEALLDALGLLTSDIDLEMRSPQSVTAGLFWQATDDLAVMADFTWIDWSRFGKVEVSISDFSGTFKVDYRDIYIGTLGLEYRFNERFAGSAGFTYVSRGVSNADRTISMPLDEFYAAGIGLQTRLTPRIDLQTNLNAIVGGDGSIDQGDPASRQGRLVGEFDRRFTIALQTSLVWRP